ncbi:MAG: ATP-binding protein [Deltaproteobacteria bacterium]|nr:ATP-binding protein [Deltaproteobacteria bacterium]
MTNADDQDIPEIGIDIADFSRLRNEGYVYVDKTEFVREILDGPRPRLFLSRPRRFGKTLLIDTLEQAAAGRKELFSGLKIERLRKDAEWPRSHVLRISMNAFGDDPSSLDLNLATSLRRFAKFRGFAIDERNSATSLTQTIETLYWNYANIPILTSGNGTEDVLAANRRKIIVLIDEYDAPIINNLTDPARLEVANRTLHGFYNALKSCENMVDRVFITGITKFSQLSVFSAMNNLMDISFKPEYATICGFSIKEISKYYSPHLDKGLAELRNKRKFGPGFSHKMFMDRIIDWYDGYSWNGKDRVINPLSLQNLLIDYEFDNFWFRTGGMTFLQNLNMRDNIFTKIFNGVENFKGSVDIQDAGNIDPIPLMLQTGYLTIRKHDESDDDSKLYLTVPNREVGMSIMKNYVDRHIIPLMSTNIDIFNSVRTKEFCLAFCQGQSDRAEELLQGFLSVIPYSLHNQKEKLYHIILLSIFLMSDFKVDPEKNVAGGIIDLVVTAPDNTILVTEIKYAKSDNEDDATDVSDKVLVPELSGKDDKKLDSCIDAAFQQIINKGYLLPFIRTKHSVRAVAVAVCGRNHVRIRSCPADELIQRPQKCLDSENSGNPAPVVSNLQETEPVAVTQIQEKNKQGRKTH